MALITVEPKGLDELTARLKKPLDEISAVRDVVAKNTRQVQIIATNNVSGTTVTFNGQSFVIQRQTGKLARSIQVTNISPLSGTIAAEAEYAAAVEGGHGPIDLKPSLRGKTVPVGVKPGTPGAVRIVQKASTGATMGSRYVVFRRVGPNSKGWIVPAAPGRPFMGAAAEEIAPTFTHELADAIGAFLGGPQQPGDANANTP